MATRAILTPRSAGFPNANAPQLLQILDSNNVPRWVLAFNDTTDETAVWEFFVPQGVTGTLTLVVRYLMASGTSGSVRFGSQIEAITDGDAVDLDGGASSFDTANTQGDTVPGTAGYMGEFTITLTNADGAAVGDYIRISLYRDADGTSGTDDASGDCYVLGAEFRDAA